MPARPTTSNTSSPSASRRSARRSATRSPPATSSSGPASSSRWRCSSNFRTREFEQMEMQFFVKPGAEDEWFERWRGLRLAWHHQIGLTPDKLRWHQHGPQELAHYARAAYDIEYELPFGIAQIGKAFRNEITPGNFIFRTREFEQMEMQFFVKPGEDGEWFER